MRWIRAYIDLIRYLANPTPIRDYSDIWDRFIRRLVARLLLIPVLAPPVVLALYGYEEAKHFLHARRVAQSICMELLPSVPASSETSSHGSAGEGHCYVEWTDVDGRSIAIVTWTESSPWSRSGQRVIERWESYDEVTVEDVEDGAGNRFVSIRPVRNGSLRIEASDDIVEDLVADVVARLP